MVFLIIIAYNKIIEISNIKTIEIFDTTPLNFIQIEKGLDKQPDPVETEKSSDLESQINIADISQKPVNINTATANQLMQIKGIGEVLAQRIIDFRTTNGNFKALEELMLIKGIGEATFEKIKPYVSLQ
jgi:competence protein ComEA